MFEKVVYIETNIAESIKTVVEESETAIRLESTCQDKVDTWKTWSARVL